MRNPIGFGGHLSRVFKEMKPSFHKYHLDRPFVFVILNSGEIVLGQLLSSCLFPVQSQDMPS